jgi:hypothetical protein
VAQALLLGAFARLRKLILGFIIPVGLSARLSIRVEQLGPYWTDFSEI